MEETNNQNISNDLKQKETKKSKSMRKILTAVLVVLIIALAAFFYYRKTKNTAQQPVNKQAFVPTVANTLPMLEQSSKLQIPEADSQNQASAADLPKEIQVSLGNYLKTATIEKIVYADQSTGYTVNFQVNKPLTGLYKDIMEHPFGGKVITGTRASLAAIIEIQTDSYYYKIVQTVAGNGLTENNINIIPIKK